MIELGVPPPILAPFVEIVPVWDVSKSHRSTSESSPLSPILLFANSLDGVRIIREKYSKQICPHSDSNVRRFPLTPLSWPYRNE